MAITRKKREARSWRRDQANIQRAKAAVRRGEQGAEGRLASAEARALIRGNTYGLGGRPG